MSTDPETRLTCREIIEETVKFYSEDPSRRGRDDAEDSCAFYTSDGKGKSCAVGRCMKAPWELSHEDRTNTAKGLDAVYGLDSLLKEPYCGHPIEFWQDLQHFHDSPHNFELARGGLTAMGEEAVTRLMANWGDRCGEINKQKHICQNDSLLV